MVAAVLAGIVLALLVPFIGSGLRRFFVNLAFLVPLSLFIWFAIRFAGGSAGEYAFTFNWAYGAAFSFYLDGLSMVFALLITGIGTLVYIYSASYMKHDANVLRFFAFLSLFMSAMLGLVLAANAITLFLFWELTSISSFFLIGFNTNDPEARKAALRALLITGAGGMALLLGCIVMGHVAGTYELQEILTNKALIRDSPYFHLIIVLIFAAAFTKSAQFPFHFWLPGAMKAPTPVSTYLHSATMVKAGIYLLFRMGPVLGANSLWNDTLIVVGGITMLYAAVHSVFRTELKSILAYTTISALGILTFLIGLGTDAALAAAIIFLLVHALYKAALFLIAGIIDHYAHERDIRRLSGLRRYLPFVATASVVASLSGAGIPLTLGFVGKELIYEATYHFGANGNLLIALAVITSVFVAWGGLNAGIRPFFFSRRATAADAHMKESNKPSLALVLPPVLLSAITVVLGIAPQLTEINWLLPAFKSAGGIVIDGHLALWHGITPVFWLSMLTIACTAVLFFTLKPYQIAGGRGLAMLRILSPQSIGEGLAHGFYRISSIWNERFQSGYLRYYMLIIVATTLSLAAAVHLPQYDWSFPDDILMGVQSYEWVVVGILVASILSAVLTQSRLVAVVAMGVAGYAMCLIFVFYGAPDLAMTQFTIDTLTVILFVLVLYKLPKYLKLTSDVLRLRDAFLSLLFGAFISGVILDVLRTQQPQSVGSYFMENAYVLARGKNVVNVILVDFRGFDTLVEITVLAVAAIGVFGLLKLRLKKDEVD